MSTTAMQPGRDRAVLRSNHMSGKRLGDVARTPVTVASLILPRRHAHAAAHGAHGDAEAATDARLLIHGQHLLLCESAGELPGWQAQIPKPMSSLMLYW